jgi:spore coat protein U-like protein
LLQLQAPLGTASGTHSLYGRIFGSQNAFPGTYADSVVVTVTY